MRTPGRLRVFNWLALVAVLLVVVSWVLQWLGTLDPATDAALQEGIAKLDVLAFVLSLNALCLNIFYIRQQKESVLVLFKLPTFWSLILLIIAKLYGL